MNKLTILLFLAISTSAFAEQVASKRIEDIIDESSNEHYETQTQAEDNISVLIGRIEVLEHKVSILEKNFEKVLTTKEAEEVANPEHPHDQSPEKTAEKYSSDTSLEKKDYDSALATFKDGNFSAAVDLFADFIEKYPESKLSSNAYFWYGESYFRQKSFEKAALYYLKGYKKAPKGAKASDSLLKLSVSLGEIDKIKEACSTLEKLRKEFPQRPAVAIKRATEAEKKFGCSLPSSGKK